MKFNTPFALLTGALQMTTLFTAVAALSLPVVASGATIGMNFVRGPGADVTGDQSTNNINSLLPADLAGAPNFVQGNWNNLGSRGTNVVVMDSSGTSSGVTVNWVSANAWSQSGGTPAAQGSPDANLMNGYLDSNGSGNVALGSNLFTNNNNSMPLVYVTGLTNWLAAQGATAYDIVIYSDGDATGRSGEYWTVDASGTYDAMTLGSDQVTHVFIFDRVNFITALTYSKVPASVQSAVLAYTGNFQGNHAVIESLTADSVLVRTSEATTRCPINALQIIPRVKADGAAIVPLIPSKVYAGGTARFRAQVSGRTPFSYQWQKNGANLSDTGNVSGCTTANLVITNVSAGDVVSYSLVVTNPNGVVTSSAAGLTLIAAPAANSFAERVFTNGAVAHWRLNDVTDPSTNYAEAYDSAGSFNGTYGSGALNGFSSIAGLQPPDFPGFENGNLGLQPSSATFRSWVTASPLQLNTNTVTMCAWINPSAAQANATGLVFTRNGGDTHGLGYGNNNNLGYNWNNQGTAFNFVSGLVPPSNQWSFVALVVTPTNATLYLYNTNGQFSATNTVAHSNATFNGLTFIGVDPNTVATPQNRAFNGVIDEVAVFKRSLSPAEIYNLYKAGLGANALPPTIATQPKSYGLFEGRSATFSVLASGDAPLFYQWRRNGGIIAGATNTFLTRSNVTIAGDAGNYDVIVSNFVNSITSSVANLTVVLSNSAPRQYEAKLRQYNPIAYWRMNETSGTPYAYDYWGGNLATNENVVQELPGPIPPDFTGMESTNKAVQYDGVSAASSTTESLMNNRAQFSIIGWFNSPGIQIQRTGLFGQNDVCEFGFHGAGTDGLAQIGIFTPRASAFLLQSNIVAGTWYLVAAIGDGTNVSLRLISTNGTGGFQVLQANTAHAATTNYGSSAFPFRIGGAGILDATGNFFNGLIDEVAVFDRALSVGELSDLFGAALLGGALPPAISSSPGSLTLYAGRTATFQVGAVGTSPHYQWRSNGVPVLNGGNLSGATTDTLTISNVSVANQAAYDVVITNVVGAVTSTPPATLTVITPTPGSYEASVIALNPLAYYRLNSTNDPSSGTEVNLDLWGGHNGLYGSASQNGFNGILGPVPPLFKFEANNGALQTTRVTPSSFATAPIGSLSTNTVTFTAWLNPNGAQDAWSGLLVNRNSGVTGGFNYNDQQMLGYTWNNNNANTYNFASGLVPPTNEWSFVAVVVTPTNAILYLYTNNTVRSATNTVNHTLDVFGNNWQIGHDNNSNNNDGSRGYNGLIDEVAVYAYSMTQDQLTALYNKGGGSIPAGPVSLDIQRSGVNVVLSWPDPSFSLVAAGQVSDTFTNVPGATSPYTNSPTAPQLFYRLKK